MNYLPLKRYYLNWLDRVEDVGVGRLTVTGVLPNPQDGVGVGGLPSICTLNS